MVISSLWGAGEGLVSAGLDADTYIVDKETLEVAETLTPTNLSSSSSIVEAGGGLMRVPVPGDLQERSSLSARR